ncbi:copper amine oxidase N-terminal domain-containing protein [Neomoorella thermoacetica]|uniref:copper amine oxidase N-terminal domain-containing protein n=1 Tax=Neomoorella thermoacetica TaxID=1525 RepID=UPI003BF5795F
MVYVDGQSLNLEQPPTIENDRILVPLREIFEALGAQVDWKADTQTVNVAKGNTTLSLTIGEQTAYKNGQPVFLDGPAKLSGERTLVPLQFVS